MQHTLFAKRLKAAAVHLGISLCVALLAAVVVIGIWYPWPFRIVSGGQELFFLVVTVDVILGPLLTLAVFNVQKSKRELATDLSIIGAIQLAALAYGLYTAAIARPVVIAFEVDRLRAVIHAEVQHDQLSQAQPEVRKLSWIGPRLVGLREAQAGEEKNKSLDLSLQGIDISMRPSYWVPYEQSKDRALARARGVDVLRKQYAAQGALIDEAVQRTGRQESQLKFLPLHARNMGWSAIIDGTTAEPLTYVPLDGFF
jgi:hypothetical protein